jgi:hypothetical protein
MDLIDTKLVDASCIVATELQLDDTTFSEFFQFKTGESDTYVGRACLYRYQCAAWNTTALYDTSIFRQKRAAASSSIIDPPRDLMKRALAVNDLHGPAAAAWMHNKFAKAAQRMMGQWRANPNRTTFTVY